MFPTVPDVLAEIDPHAEHAELHQLGDVAQWQTARR